MTPVSRSAQFVKAHKVLKKHYKPVAPPADRPVLEHLLFACCLEDARYEAAEEAFAALVHTFFDWNEVRVTSLSELSEVMAALPDPRVAANRIKRVLHGIFEASYSFDLEDKRKKNLGPTVKWLEKIDGTTRFSVAYVVQAALGGHSIPVDTGSMAVLRLADLVSEADAAAGAVPGMERAIAKSKGIEFGSLLHQLAAEFSANPFAPQVRQIILEINPEAKDRFPQRRAPQELAPAAAEAKSAAGPAEAATPRKRRKKAEDKSEDKSPAAEAASPPAPAEKMKDDKPKDDKPKEDPAKENEAEKPPRAAKKSAAAAGESHAKKEPPSPAADETFKKEETSRKKASATAAEGLSKRKPR